ncbi:complement factor I-like [Boleophthalmus pectinirostris]|uniref:complement factor I-like n=1 Tax=Boleophthalmus pectinirostris TaxID=150288 RepID=UPI00242F9553|nr:complement factor I-like [Boleophthalmus pectinirostris]
MWVRMKLTGLFLLLLLVVLQTLAENRSEDLDFLMMQRSKIPHENPNLGPEQCLKQRHTRASCSLVFCYPWERCVNGKCICKPQYLCPTQNVTSVCGRDHRGYRSYCQAMASSCQSQLPVMSHFADTCSSEHKIYSSSEDPDTGAILLEIPNPFNPETADWKLICGSSWNKVAANVYCKERQHPLGAQEALKIQFSDLKKEHGYPKSCVHVECEGFENNLGECRLLTHSSMDHTVAKADCYSGPIKGCNFNCVNSKCISRLLTCDGVDDCGDRSDEMCCQKCSGDAFRCNSGVCIPRSAVGDGVRDCLDGGDEVKTPEQIAPDLERQDPYVTTPKNEIRLSRQNMESQVKCGVPNMNIVDDEAVVERGRGRTKRVAGGVPTTPHQIQWQVAVVDSGMIRCGGAYIGGCWVLTAASCVRSDPSGFMVKLSLWKRNRAQTTTEIVPVQNIHIHPQYNNVTDENDIALVELRKLPFQEKCFSDNPVVRPVCVPWTPHLFQPNHTCTISGWGRTTGGRPSTVLLWAKVSLIPECERYYENTIKAGMICAGNLDGSVDACAGDGGGPLVCEDELGVSYLWGIVSWGKGNCGNSNSPGVYTQVAHFYEWIRIHTGWPLVTQYNS